MVQIKQKRVYWIETPFPRSFEVSMGWQQLQGLPRLLGLFLQKSPILVGLFRQKALAIQAAHRVLPPCMSLGTYHMKVCTMNGKGSL